MKRQSIETWRQTVALSLNHFANRGGARLADCASAMNRGAENADGGQFVLDTSLAQFLTKSCGAVV